MKNIITLFSRTSGSWPLVPLRLILALIFMAHGAQKLFGWFGGYGLEGTAGYFQEQLGMSPGILWAFLAAATELFGGLFLFAGLLSRLQGIILALTMMVALVTVHNSSFFLPTGMEYILLLIGSSLVFVLGGAGNASIDYYLTKNIQK